MKAHIQSLAKLDKEELAEKLFHAKMALSNLEEKNVGIRCFMIALIVLSNKAAFLVLGVLALFGAC